MRTAVQIGVFAAVVVGEGNKEEYVLLAAVVVGANVVRDGRDCWFLETVVVGANVVRDGRDCWFLETVVVGANVVGAKEEYVLLAAVVVGANVVRDGRDCWFLETVVVGANVVGAVVDVVVETTAAVVTQSCAWVVADKFVGGAAISATWVVVGAE